VRAYLDLMREILQSGSDREDRTGVGTRSLFARHLRFDLAAGFPLLTTKKVHFRSVLIELLWFLRGETNIAYLQENNVSIWNEWADASGELGPVYGRQWRAWQTSDGRTLDQITELERLLREDPTSRRLLVSAWNVGQLADMALPPCHLLFQFYVADGRLSCQMYQRSADLFLGVPFNIASYALLTEMLAHVHGLQGGELTLTFGDVHLYRNHFQQAETQLARTPGRLPRLELLRQPHSVLDYQFQDVQLVDYDPQPHIPAPVAV
jgi:thymidylate synthase